MADVLRCWFFMSYAWADNPENDGQASFVSMFHRAVETAIQAKVDEALDRYGFLDRKTIELGDAWKVKLVSALGGCRAFVPLLTSRYVSSASCGREWAALDVRRKGQASKPRIEPIFWDAPHRVSTKAIDDDLHAQFSERDFGTDVAHFQQYKRLGMSALVQRMGTDASASTTVTVMANAIADRIVDGWRAAPVAGRAARAHRSVGLPRAAVPCRRARPPPGDAGAVHFAVAAATAGEIGDDRRAGALRYYPATEREWIPYAEASVASAAQLAIETSLEFELPVRWLDAKGSLAADIRRLEANGNAPVVVLVDPWSLRLRALQASLGEYDRQRFANAIVILAWNLCERRDNAYASRHERKGELEGDVRAIFARSYPTSGESADFNAKVTDIDTLRAALVRAVTVMRGITALGRKPQRPVEAAAQLPLNRNQS